MFSRWSVPIDLELRPSRVLLRFSDYIAGGTLKNLILDLSIPLSWLERLRYAKDISAGMVASLGGKEMQRFRLFLGISSLVQHHPSRFE